MRHPQPTAENLRTLLRLIDDETPEVRASVAEAIEAFEGDVSEILPEPLEDPQASLTLSRLLLPARRRRLRREWVVPAAGAHALVDDWERFESLLRILSDFLHDGLSLRQPLGDAIDLLAEEAEEAYLLGGAEALVETLLADGRLVVDTDRDPNPLHLDLASVADGVPSNACGIGLVLILVAHRLGADIQAINLPGTFFLRLETERGPVLLDPEHGGAEIDAETFAHRIRRYPRDVRMLASRPATPGELLLRVTNDLATAFAVHDQEEDAELMDELFSSLLPD